jgi:Holliday junction resolvase RusA-like endonuclease
MTPVYSLHAAAIAYSMKNRRRQVWRRGKPKLILSPEADAAFKIMVAEFKGQWAKAGRAGRPLTGSLVLILKLYYPSARHDGGDDLVKDALQRAGVVKNDRLFTVVTYVKFIDKARPRVEVEISPYETRPQA